MKILYVSDYPPEYFTFINQDVKYISKNNEVMYLTFEDGKYKRINRDFKIKKINYPTYSLKSKVRWRLEKLGIYFNWYDKKFSEKINKEIEKFNPEIIHCQFAYESAKLLHNYSSNIPTILNFRGFGASHKLKNKFYVNWLKKILNKKNIYPIYVSNSLKKNLLKKGIKTINNGIILHTGIDTKKFKRKNYNKNEITKFIQVGNFNDKKGQYYTIKAFYKLNKSNPKLNINLTFVGEGKNLKKCKKLAKKLKLSDKIFFVNKQNHKVVVDLLNSSNIFVHHSVTSPNGDQEGIPNAILEAMSMEMPILSTFHSGIPEAVVHNVNGLICNEKDLNTYSKHMKKIIDWGFIKENRDKVQNEFSINNHINKLNSFYISL